MIHITGNQAIWHLASLAAGCGLIAAVLARRKAAAEQCDRRKRF
jgi:hypothetical protein